jgi:hypothetical protein
VRGRVRCGAGSTGDVGELRVDAVVVDGTELLTDRQQRRHLGSRDLPVVGEALGLRLDLAEGSSASLKHIHDGSRRQRRADSRAL